MSLIEYPVCFRCNGETLVGILHPAAAPSETGIVIVVGGPQYRIGSHRHFVELGRELSNNGVPVMRFDVRGMGDSSGTFPGFEAIDDDIAAAIDVFIREEPYIENVVLWGLCDGASASMFYAPRDRRLDQACGMLVERGICVEGEEIVFVAGVPPGVAHSTNMMKLHRVGETLKLD